MFNHESPLRGETFVTRKITRGLSKVRVGLQDHVVLGNINAKRDWGHAEDYVEAMWLMMQHEQPRDFVIATGKNYSVREFIEKTAKLLDFELIWDDKGKSEVGLDKKTGKVLIKVSESYLRPADVQNLLGDSSKAFKALGWTPKHDIDSLIGEMVKSDLEIASRLRNLKESDSE